MSARSSWTAWAMRRCGRHRNAGRSAWQTVQTQSAGLIGTGHVSESSRPLSCTSCVRQLMTSALCAIMLQTGFPAARLHAALLSGGDVSACTLHFPAQHLQPAPACSRLWSVTALSRCLVQDYRKQLLRKRADGSYERYCSTCYIWRPPRAHHCSVCGYCMVRGTA